MSKHFLFVAPLLVLAAGCGSNLAPKFEKVQTGQTRDEVTALMGMPDAIGDVGAGKVGEQWEYSDSRAVYVVRFGPRSIEPRELWRVVAMNKHARGTSNEAFAKVMNGMTRKEVAKLMGKCTSPARRQSPDPSQSYDGPYKAIQTLLMGGFFEEWGYVQDGHTYLVWFGSPTGGSETDWTVIGKVAYKGLAETAPGPSVDIDAVRARLGASN